MRQRISKYGFHITATTIILLLAGLVSYVGDLNNKCLHVIDLQRETIDNQQRVIESLSGVDIPEGYEAVPAPQEVY